MLSHETKSKLATFLLSLSEGERQLELMRQILCEKREFEPYTAFCRIDRVRRGFLTSTDIKRFLAENSIQHSEKACAAYVRRYSGKEGDFVSSSEFLKSVLTVDNSTLRTMATQRPNYKIGYDEYLADDVEYTLSKIIDREITFYMNADYDKYSLAKRYDYSHLDAFATIDRFNSGRIDYDNLKSFFRGLAQFPTDEELIAILRRMDKDDDGIVKYAEFVEALEPLDPEIKYEQSFKKTPNKTNFSTFYETSPQRKIATPNKIQSSDSRSIREEHSGRFKANLSPMKKTPIPGRTVVYSPSKTYSPNPYQFRKTAEEIYTDQRLRSISKEKKIKTPSTAEKTSPVKKSISTRIDAGLSGSKQVRKVLDYEREESRISIDALIDTIKQFIALDKDLEVAKQDLALRPDFNLLDFFRAFDPDGKGAITYSELEDGFKKFSVFPSRDELYLFLTRYDCDNDGKIRFSDFTCAFTPIQNEYYTLLNNRKAVNADLNLEIKELLSVETRKSISRILRLHLDIEASAEILKQKLNKKFGFSAHSSFNLLDLNNDGQITIDELRESLDAHKTFVTDKELKLLIQRFDADKDGRISYSEFLQEIKPKTDKKKLSREQLEDKPIA